MPTDNEAPPQDKTIDIGGNENNVEEHITNTTNTGGGANFGGPINVGTGVVTGRDNITTNDNSVTNNNFITAAATTRLLGSAPAYPQLMLGREDDLHHLKTYLGVIEDRATPAVTSEHLVVVHGWPGVGKTTLAAALAHDKDIEDAFPEGVLWVSLGPDPNLFSWLMAWGRSLNTDITNARTLEEASAQLTALLLAQKRLIIVDDVWNPKHVLPFKIGGSDCAMLITTRSPSVAQALAPTANDIYKLKPLEDEMARDVLRALAPTVMEQNLKEMDELIYELGGLPLVLQVVGRLLNTQANRGFNLQDLLTKLRTGDRLLKSIVPIGVEKMENIESTISVLFQKSTDPLGEKLIHYFASLSVFAAPPATFDLAAMQAVWQLENPESAATELIDRGLLEYVPNEQSYRMHALFHHHAQSLLTDKDAQKACRNHFNFFQRFATGYPDTDLNKWGTDKIQKFETSYPQMKQALVNFELGYGAGIPTTNTEQNQQMIKLINTLDKYWLFHNQFDHQVKWLTVAYQCAKLLDSPLQTADFARRIGRAKGWQIEFEDGFKWLEVCETVLQGHTTNEDANKIRALMYIHRAFLNYQTDELAAAQKDCMQGLRMITKKKEPEIYAEGYNLLGVIKHTNNKISAAQKDFEKSLSTWKQVQNHYQIARVEENIRSIHFYLGDIKYLRDADEKGLKDWEKSKNLIQLTTALINRAEINRIDRESDIAIERQKRAIAISQQIKIPRLEALTKTSLAVSYISLGEYDTAATLLQESNDIREEYHLQENSIDARLCWVEIEIGRNNYTEALKNAKIALQEAREVKDELEKGCAQRTLGRIYHLIGKTEQARKYLEQSFSQLEKNEYRYESFLTLKELIKFYEELGDIEKAQAANQKAQDLSNDMGLLPPKTTDNQH